MLPVLLKRLLKGCCRSGRQPERSGLAYWEERTKAHGRRAVLNLGHHEDIEAVTRRQLDIIVPHLAGSVCGNDRVILDFGCGPGRFTPYLARLLNGRAIGIDPIRTLIDLAPRAPDVEYQVSDGRRIPLADGSVDVAWVCLVLGGLPDAQLPETVCELERVLRSGGLLFLVENTSVKENCSHWIFRSVAAYQQLFAFAPLAHLHDYDDLGERISIMAGRKEPGPQRGT